MVFTVFSLLKKYRENLLGWEKTKIEKGIRERRREKGEIEEELEIRVNESIAQITQVLNENTRI